MKLSFPNPSRSFDPIKNRIQFWGYLKSVEISFYVDGAVLLKQLPNCANDRDGLLAAFDACADKIHKVADAEYLRRGTFATSYNLPARVF